MRNLPLTPAFRPVVVRLKWKRAVFNGLPRPRCIQRCGLRRHHEKPLKRLNCAESGCTPGLKAGLMRKELAPDARGALAATDATHILTRQSFETEREQILQRPIVVDLHPASAALRLRRGIQYRRDVTAAFNQKDLRVRPEFVTGIWKIRV